MEFNDYESEGNNESMISENNEEKISNKEENAVNFSQFAE